MYYNTNTHTHPFNGSLSRTTQVSRYQKGKTNLDLTEARDSEWQWHQLGDMQVCTSLQTDSHAGTPPLSFFTGRMPFLPPNQQCQSTEGSTTTHRQTLYPLRLQAGCRKRRLNVAFRCIFLVQHKIYPKKTKPGLVAFCDIRPAIGAGLRFAAVRGVWRCLELQSFSRTDCVQLYVTALRLSADYTYTYQLSSTDPRDAPHHACILL